MRVKVKCKRRQGSWRAGRFWAGNGWTVADLSEAQVELLQDDPRLEVTDPEPEEPITPPPPPKVEKKAVAPRATPKKKATKKTAKKPELRPNQIPLVDTTDPTDDEDPSLERIPMGDSGGR